MGFSTNNMALGKLLESIHTGNSQLPEFQRNWVWDDQRIKDLLISVIRGHPVGAIMLLETGNQSMHFKPRLLEGVTASNSTPENLILDGQQRLTSLYGVLKSNQVIVTTDDRRKQIERWYYADLKKLLEFATDYDEKTDWDELIVSVPADKKQRNFRGEVIADYSSQELECKAGMFPLGIVFDEAQKTYWLTKFVETHGGMDQWVKVFERLIKPVTTYEIPVIKLDKNESKEAVCKVFEKVNTGGVALDVFELLTATFAAEDFDLREDWTNRQHIFVEHKVLENIASTDFLQSITLLVTLEQREQDLLTNKRPDEVQGVSCKRKNILNLTTKDYKNWANKLQNAFLEVAQFLLEQGIFEARDLPYRTQLIPLATILASMNGEVLAGNRQKLTQWYWCGIFGELYGSATETRFAKDVVEVHAWLRGGEEPSTVKDCNFAVDRLVTLTTRNSAAYKGVHALLMHSGCVDLLEGKSINAQLYLDEKVDIHHIFPKAWCVRQGVDAAKRESVVNKTPISSHTNRIISDHAPSVYTIKLANQAKITPSDMDHLLTSHLIDPNLVRADNFEEFFAARQNALIERIEAVTKKKVLRPQ
jgi:hypothetical protein